jgi:hypothetical protein
VSKVNDGVRAAGYASLKAAHDELNLTGGDSWSKFYRDMVPDAPSLGDAMAEYWGGATGGIYRRAVFALDARKTPGRLSTNVIQDLSSNALRTANGTTGNAKIVQDGRGGKALRTHGVAATNVGARSSLTPSYTSGTIRCEARIRTPEISTGLNQTIAAGNTASGNLVMYRFETQSDGGLVRFTLANGLTSVSVPFNGLSLTPGNNTWITVAGEWDPVSGDVVWQTSADNGSSWTTVETDTAAFPVGLGSVQAPGQAGIGIRGSASPYNGLIGWARVYFGGTMVTDFDPSRDASFSSLSWTSGTTGETWTVTPGGADNSDVLFLPYTGERYVYLPGIAGNYLSAPDEAALDITGDIDLRACFASDSWAPATTQSTLCKDAASPNRGYRLEVAASTGNIRIAWSTDGNTAGLLSMQSDVSMSTVATAGQPCWIRATLDVDDGSGNRVANFYYSLGADEPTAWTQLGSTVTVAGTTNIAPVGSVLEIGTYSNGSAGPCTGKVHAAQVRNGIDGPVVFDWSASDTVNATHTAFTASTGQTVTVNRATTGRKTCVVEANKWLLGTDDYIEVADNALLDLDADDDFTVLWVGRNFNDSPNGMLVGKRVSAGTSGGPYLGWGLSTLTASAGVNRTRFTVDDGTNFAATDSPNVGWTAGALSAIAGVLDRPTATVSINGTTSSVDASAVGDMSNAFAMRLGRAADAGLQYGHHELYAVYIWREALTASELAAIAADWGAA